MEGNSIMRKLGILILTTIVFCFLLVECKQNNNAIVKEPDITQIRSICNLATLECYYHNVAKSKKPADSWLKKEREFWIEYTGIAKIGIDMSKVNMEISGKNVTVSLPNAELLDIDIYENDLNKESYIKSADGLVKNKITADDQTSAINSAQIEMSESVKNNKSLLLNAQDRAQELIENYIKKMGEISNIDYQIKWSYEDSSLETNIEKNTENKQTD